PVLLLFAPGRSARSARDGEVETARWRDLQEREWRESISRHVSEAAPPPSEQQSWMRLGWRKLNVQTCSRVLLLLMLGRDAVGRKQGDRAFSPDYTLVTLVPCERSSSIGESGMKMANPRNLSTCVKKSARFSKRTRIKSRSRASESVPARVSSA